VPHPLYGGKPACRQAVAKGSASAGAMPMAVQKPPELKDGCDAPFACSRAVVLPLHWPTVICFSPLVPRAEGEELSKEE
jgi:hypothetical protein